VDSGFPSGSCSIVGEPSSAGGPFVLPAGDGFSGTFFFPGNSGAFRAHLARVAAGCPSGISRCTLRCLRPSVGAISPKPIRSQEWPGLSGQHPLDPRGKREWDEGWATKRARSGRSGRRVEGSGYRMIGGSEGQRNVFSFTFPFSLSQSLHLSLTARVGIGQAGTGGVAGCHLRADRGRSGR
jgi:hypothetical protein